MARIYLAGGLFNAAERLHNLFLEKHLRELGHEVLLPQREALKFFEGDRFNIDSIVGECKRSATNPKIVYVGSVDGADADSGTAVEYGMAIVSAERAIIYRTDFRTAEEKEVGVNAMFRIPGTIYIYHPCFFTELDQVDVYYKELAHKIHETILAIIER